ncbi:uncharacterized protein LOC115622997 [Scaptodrosophila lebanonensis]|uniref:Uncharacterized protein LOC115622997 n=1 Tax=Drosophila lebanonensis TaxID=7225 RepID=A0A6J2T7U5_DROLE|nr:uncharacterized protein LOC115622997 [Scaptodrosophila lebanonensis]
MFFKYTLLLLAACCLALVASGSVPMNEGSRILARHARSPKSQGGSVDLGYRKDAGGREASIQYNHNLYTSRDGRGSIDAYAQGSRNFDHNRNNYGGGIQGRWRF